MNKCKTGKARYKDELDAKIALASTQRSRTKSHQESRVYKCPFCRGWHLTSKGVR